MLTRRSRKDATSPNDSNVSPKKKSTTPRRQRSRSTAQRSSSVSSTKKPNRPRSKSASKKKEPKVVLERFENKDSAPTTRRGRRTNSITRKDEKTPVKESIISSIAGSSRSSPLVDKQIINDKVSNSTTSRVLSYESDASDDESLLKNKKTPISSPVEFGGLFGNITLFVLLPILVILSKIALKAKGILIPFPRGYLRLANYYDREVYLWTAAILAIQFLISLVPLAKKSENLSGRTKIYYRFSGFMNFIICTSIVAAMDYYKCPINFILDMVTKKTVPHIVASVLLTLIITIVLYVKAKISKQIDTLNSFNLVQNLFIGTTNNPTLGPINIKLALYRYSMLMTILFNALVIMDSLKNPVNINLYFICGLQIFYAVDKLVFEINLLPSFYLQNEKDGYWTILQQFLQPVINFLPVQILLAKNLPINYFILGISSVLFLLGYVCQRYSEFTKYMCESDAKYFSRPGLKTVLTSDGRKIILSSLWSFVRYPNILGAIVVHSAIILPAIELNIESLQATWPIFLYPLYYIVTLSHQCVRASTHSLLQYGSTWDRHYEVKWNLIPRIF